MELYDQFFPYEERYSKSVIADAERTLKYVMGVIAHPHTTFTEHDRHRAIELIRYMHSDETKSEYLFSQMTPDDFKAIKAIRSHVSSNQ